MRQSATGRAGFAAPVLCVALVTAACAPEQEQMIPLGGDAASDARSDGTGQLSEAAQATLQRGNEAFRAGQFAMALEQYRRASLEAPGSASPWIGILMAAQKLGNAALADTASRMAAALSGGNLGVHGPDPHAGLDSATRARIGR